MFRERHDTRVFGPRRLSVYVIALGLSFMASFASFDDLGYQWWRWMELISRR